ncbi:UNVERIFIED_CONTAM: hypothetical protein PYX00_002220 [Menopon gallinae]|uniref:DM10 domain-containing protein n=1 Tax=Menopon gallinae TaxID=328185 RepID=A0AAW2IFT7_9NEOP
MLRTPKLPVLPGYSFEREIGQTKYHKSTQFELLRGDIPYLTEADRPGPGGYPICWMKPDLYPSVYPRRETKELPGWIAYDKQILTFEAYFQQAAWEIHNIPYQIRKVKILFFLEDGTVQVNEPRVDNSGMTQGTLIYRQRIRFPKPMDENFYEMIDFNIGKNVELYGKVFRIVNCDNFTRQFLNRMGIFVGDPLDYPEDPQSAVEAKKKDETMGRKPRKRDPPSGKFIEFDKCILKFYGYWDDRPSTYGYLHKMEVLYFLADDTIEIKEIIPPNSGIDNGPTFLKRGKLPKSFDHLLGIGDTDSYPLLNVLSTGFLSGRYVVDPIGCGAAKITYYQDKDLAIGTCLNVYGRKIVLTDCDPYTKEYYRVKYGMDTFNKLDTPDEGDRSFVRDFELPPWNGIGTFEDSEMNCRMVLPQAPKKDFYKILVKGRVGYDSHILRFSAKMLSHEPVNDIRNFIISYYLSVDQVSVYERASRNSGFASQLFCSKREIFKPGQEMFVPKKPDIFLKDDFWIGNVLKLEGFRFLLTGADDYCFRYMELNCSEFPKSNINLIMDKIREKLKPVYKDFAAKHFKPYMNTSDTEAVITFQKLKIALKELMGDNITEHEIITVARRFRALGPMKRHGREVILNASRGECKKKLWVGLDRLKENIMYKDVCGTGFLPRNLAYAICKGAKIPIEYELLDSIFEVVETNECGEVCIDDLLCFFGDKQYCERAKPPINQKREFSEFFKKSDRVCYACVDLYCLLKNLGLEEEMGKPEEHAPLALPQPQSH